MTDRTEVSNAFRLWFKPGDVFEVRVLDALTTDYMRPHVESGYFDYDHIDTAASAVMQLRSYRGAYATVNPVKPDLLARAANRLRAVGREPTTADTDILERRWLLVDCDAVRPSGISSNDSEHEAAIAKAVEIRNGLGTLGWPEPIMADSGNGAQLMYRIQLPADDNGLVQRCLGEIAKASDAKVKVDTTVHNPARIWRIPGTMNCKGDHTEARPHRQARLLSKPENPQPVTLEQLQEILLPPAAEIPASPDNGFDLSGWITRHYPQLGEPEPWNGGQRWIFPVCPFNPEHTNKSAVLLRLTSGAIAFRCHHNGCSGNDWHKLRQLSEPDMVPDKLEVDCSAFILPSREIVVPREPEIIKPWQCITNADIRAILKDTILGGLCDYYATATRPPLPLEVSLLKAIVTVACALSERGGESKDPAKGNLYGVNAKGAQLARLKINTAGGQVCNAYTLTVGNSASGKDIGDLLSHTIGHYGWDLGTSGSAEGILDALIKQPNGLQTISELMNWLDAKHYLSKASSVLTEVFSAGYFKHNLSHRANAVSRISDYVYPSIYANIQPEVFAKYVKRQDVTSGFLGRFLMVRMPPFFGRPHSFDFAKVLNGMVTCVDMFRRKKGVVEVMPDYLEDISQMFIRKSPPNLIPSWRRLVNEYGPRFAVMLSVTRDPLTQGEEVILTERCWQGAERLVLWFFSFAERLLINVEDISSPARDRERLLTRILGIVKRHMPQGARWSDISNHASYGSSKAERAEALDELVDRSWILPSGQKTIADRGRLLTVAERYFLGNPPSDTIA